MSHPPPAFSFPSGPPPPAPPARVLTALSLSPATSPTDGPGFDTLTNEGVGVFVPLWAIRRALMEGEAEEGMRRGEGEGGGADATAPGPSQRSTLPAQPALFPSLPLLSSSSSSSVHSSNLPTRSMGTPFEAGVGGEGQPRARASFAFPSSTTTTTLPPAYFPPPPHARPAPLPQAPFPLSTQPRPLPSSPAFNSETSDSDSDLSNHPSPHHSSAALAGPALQKARADFLARDYAYSYQPPRSRGAGGSSEDGDGEAQGWERGRARGRESDAEWVPESEEAGGEGRGAGVSTKGKGRKRGVEAGGAGGAAGGMVTEPATEPLSIRWTPSLHAFLPSNSPYRSLSPTRPSTILTFPPSSYIRVFTSSSRAPESEVFPYSSSSAKRNTFLRALLAHRFPSLSCACGFGFLRPSTTGGGGEGKGEWKKPSILRDHLARCAALGEEEEGVKRLCALERGVGVEKVGKGRAKE